LFTMHMWPIDIARVRRAAAVYGPAVLLSLVAAGQMVAVHVHPERPRWKGGGFGMYTEIYSLRHFCMADKSRGETPLSRYEPAVRQFRALGAPERLDVLYALLQQNGVPVQKVIAGRKRMDKEAGEYRVHYVPLAEYPPAGAKP
jgi:hypothetical protein